MSGKAHVTIEGLNFGPKASSASARLGLSICATTWWSSISSLSCESVAGNGIEVMVVVTITQLTGSKYRIFTFDVPALSYAYPQNVAVSGHSMV